MSVSSLFYPHAIKLAGGPTITHLMNPQASFGHRDLIEFSAGQTAPQFTGTHDAVPDLTFGTAQAADFLGVFGSSGEYVCADLSGGNTDIEYKAGANSGLRVADATTSHLRGRMASNAFLCWQSLAARQGGLAEIRARLVPFKAAGADPLVFTNGVALTATSAISHLYTLGPVKLNGSFIGGVDDANWENNLQMREIVSDGEEFPSHVSVQQFSPVLTFRCLAAEVMASMTARGTALNALSFFLRKKSAAGINVADATTAHVKFTASAGVIKARSVSGNASMAEVAVLLQKPSATDPPFTISTASAIS